jgi:SAM-dependent methyltransferase
VLLNLGAGPATDDGIRSFRGEVARVVGADIDPCVLENDECDEAHVINGEILPFEENRFDIVVSDFVLEHLASPEPFLREVRRVLKPGGSFFFRTPNKYHYVATIARLTPHWFHELVANWAQGAPSGSHEPYPTYYRINSVENVKRFARMTGFTKVELELLEHEPSYLVFHVLPFLAGVVYERLVNRFENLAWLRVNILGRLEK